MNTALQIEDPQIQEGDFLESLLRRPSVLATSKGRVVFRLVAVMDENRAPHAGRKIGRTGRRMQIGEISLAVATIFEPGRAVEHMAIGAVARQICQDCLERRLCAIALGGPGEAILPGAMAYTVQPIRTTTKG